MKATMKAVWTGVLVATMLPVWVMAQSPKMERLFRAGLGVSETFPSDPVMATVQPLKIEIAVAKTKATTADEKAIVAAYDEAVKDLTDATESYHYAVISEKAIWRMAAMKARVPRPTDEELVKKVKPLAIKQISAEIAKALKRLEEAHALYTAKPATKE